jgi:hypothetical protein
VNNGNEMDSNAQNQEDEKLYPQQKRRYQSTQLMNLLTRPIIAPLIKVLSAVGLSGDMASLLGLFGYGIGAYFFVQGDNAAIVSGLYIFMAGAFFELIDGGLARLRGPSAIGHFFAKFLESVYIVLLAPCLAIGLFVSGQEGVGVLLVGVLGALCHIQFRGAVEHITSNHSSEDFTSMVDGGASGIKRLVIAQFLPDHPLFTWRDRSGRIVRENLMESSGIQPIILIAFVAAGHAEYFVLYYGTIHICAWLGFVALKLVMLRSGGVIL